VPYGRKLPQSLVDSPSILQVNTFRVSTWKDVFYDCISLDGQHHTLKMF
jgi:hypothetical protein